MSDTPLWLVLKNAHRLFKRHAQFRSVPLWGFVSELTGHGSTVSSEICTEFGWNPDEFTAKAELPYPKAGDPKTEHDWQWYDRNLRATGYTDLANRMLAEFKPQLVGATKEKYADRD